MTVTSIPLSALPVVDPWRRDQWGRYLILPPDGDKPIGYTRATTVAKVLDDGELLPTWKAALTACGTVMRPGLFARWEALLAEHGDPWYAGDEAKRACKDLVADCARVGGADDRAEQGTALHTITALFDLERDIHHLSAETEADLNAYSDRLAAAGIELIAGQIELTVVLDQERIAGTFDRLVNVPGFELPLVADLKTGRDLSYSWHYIATQLAIYSRGDCTYRQGPATDGSEDVRTPMPTVDQDNGLVIWLPAGSGQCRLFVVNLNAGWEAVEHALWTREWRKDEMACELGEGRWERTDDESLVPALEASLAALGEPVIDVDQPQPAGDAEPEAEPVSFTMQLRAWLQGRIDVIGAHPEARERLMRDWPAGVVSLLKSDDHSAEELQKIENLCNLVEKRHRMPFPDPRPEPEDDTALVIHIFPNATPETKEPTA